MKRIFAISCLVLASGFATTAFAQTAPTTPAPAAVAPQSGPSKVAFIYFQPALASTNEGKRALEALQKKYEPEQTHLKALNDEIENLKKQLQNDGPKLSQSEGASRQQTIDTKDKQLQLEAQDASTREQSDLQDTFAKIADKVGKVMVDYAQKQGFTAIMDMSGQQTTVLWYTQGADITQAVIEAYNASTPSITAPAAPAAAPMTPRSTTPRPAGPARQ
jgi:Skp family chaperone for outer membrane proteins